MSKARAFWDVALVEKMADCVDEKDIFHGSNK